jgi:ABC-type multidrug transport system fused ATPase/permease subunit
MVKKNKIINILIKIGLGILSVLSFLFLNNVFNKKGKEKVKENIDKIKEATSDLNKKTSEDNKIITSMKETMRENQKDRNKIVDDTMNKIKKKAKKAGFKKG